MLHTLVAITGFDGDPERTFVDRVYPELCAVLDNTRQDVRVVFASEIPPPTFRADHGARIGQAAIGYPLGYCTGLAASAVLLAHRSVLRFPVSEWRATMIEHAASARMLIQRPGRPRKTGRPEPATINTRVVPVDGHPHQYNCTYRGCDHVHVTTSIDLAAGRTPTRCPTCSPVGTDAFIETEEDITEAWKRTACAYAKALYPDAYEMVVADARGRARTEKPDHQLAGVPDACEALAIALHAGRVTRSGADPEAPAPESEAGPARP